MYFRAFSLYQTGSVDRMREARDVLKALGRNYPNADLSDAKALGTRVCGELAQRGDANCAAEIFAAAEGQGQWRSVTERHRSRKGTQGTKCVEDDDDDERVAALNALLQMDSERAMPILKKVLARRDACSDVLRRKAVFLVSQKGGDEAADILVQAAKTDPIRRHASRPCSGWARSVPIVPSRCSRRSSRTRQQRDQEEGDVRAIAAAEPARRADPA